MVRGDFVDGGGLVRGYGICVTGGSGRCRRGRWWLAAVLGVIAADESPRPICVSRRPFTGLNHVRDALDQVDRRRAFLLIFFFLFFVVCYLPFVF